MVERVDNDSGVLYGRFTRRAGPLVRPQQTSVFLYRHVARWAAIASGRAARDLRPPRTSYVRPVSSQRPSANSSLPTSRQTNHVEEQTTVWSSASEMLPRCLPHGRRVTGGVKGREGMERRAQQLQRSVRVDGGTLNWPRTARARRAQLIRSPGDASHSVMPTADSGTQTLTAHPFSDTVFSER